MEEGVVQRLIGQAWEHQQAGRLEQAAELYQQILSRQPDHPAAIHYLGAIANEQGQWDQARTLLERAAKLAPNEADYHFNFGIILLQRALAADAVTCLSQVVKLNPDDGLAHNILGVALLKAGRADDALAAWQRAVILCPDSADIHSNLGLALQESGKITAALEEHRAAIRLDPDYAAAHHNLAIALHKQGRLDQAIIHHRQAISLRPDAPSYHSSLLLAMQFHAGVSEQALADEHDEWVRRHAQPLMCHIRPHDNDRTPGRRLRIGYISPDFRQHVVGWLIEPVLAGHDPDAFEVVCYCDNASTDDITRRLQSHVGLWRNVSGMSNLDLAGQIRRDRIDILVDLDLHLWGHRMLTFATKPAPIQVTYLGYNASTGLPTMDYRITDANMDPPGQAVFGPEQLLHLPHCYWVYRPLADSPPVSSPPALRDGRVTFGSFNNFAKVNHAVVALWAQIITRVKGSRLLIVVPGGEAENPHVRAMFAGHGVGGDQLCLHSMMPPADYLRLYSQVDISLDPYPYNGGVTSLDSLWMGVPVVTLVGARAVARAGLTLLTNLNLTELAAHTPDDYLRIAVELAGDGPRLAQLRQGLRDRLRNSALMDEAGFVRDLEGLYRSVWKSWCGRSSAAL